MKTGEPVSTFGENGIVPNTGTSTSPPSIYRDVVMIQDNGPNIQAYDARTGRKLWQTELIAQPGDPNQATWLNDSWKEPVGGTDVWGIMSIDPARGMLFAPVSKAGNDYWGGPHHGNNLYSDSVVAIDAMTGNMVWHYQTVHHDIWDFDLGAAPTLLDVRHDGRLIPAVAQITKMGLLFVLQPGDRTTHLRRRGTSRPTDEGTRRVDVADAAVPAEASAARPHEHDEGGACRDWKDLARARSVLPGAVGAEQYCRLSPLRTLAHGSGGDRPSRRARRWKLGRRLVPPRNWIHRHQHPQHRAVGHPRASRSGSGPRWTWRRTRWRGTRCRGRAGGAPPQPPPAAGGVGHRAAPTGYGKRTPEQGRFWNAEKRWPCNPGPWGELVAIDTATGDVAWRSTLGGFEELEARGIKTGTAQLGGAITTAGNLVFIGATIDSKFRAFDVRTGAELWVDRLDAPAHSVPSTYLGRDGKQYVVVAAGGRGFLQSPGADTLVAYTLP